MIRLIFTMNFNKIKRPKRENHIFCADSTPGRQAFWRLGLVSIILIFVLLILSPFVIAPPPTPHGISGYIFEDDGVTQVPLGTKYSINDSTSGFYLQSQTSFPIPGYSGYYSETIQGNDGDNVTIIAWNLTSYGETKVVLNGTMSGVNVTLNLTRDPEPTVNITFPDDNTLRNDSVYFEVLSNLTLYGSAGTNCQASISYSNTSVLASYNNESTTLDLGSLQSGWTTIITWNVSGIGMGVSNITINFTCDGQGMKFEELNDTDTLINITIEDTTPPSITLIFPPDNHITENESMTFQYNVTDNSGLINCSLYINGSLRQTNNTPQRDVNMSFNDTINEGSQTWYIECFDSSGNQGVSTTYTITLDTASRTISSDKSGYVQGDTVMITGLNWTNNSIVTILLSLPDVSTRIWNTTAANKIVNTTYFINYSDPTGQYNITAYEYLYQFYNATNNFTVNQRTQSLTTDKQVYDENEIVQINGYNFTLGGNISIRIFKNDTGITGPGFPVYIDANSSGDFYYEFNVTDICSGIYGIEAIDQDYVLYEETIYINTTKGTPCTDWSNVAPVITEINVDDGVASPANEVDLLAGSMQSVDCTVTVKDDDGYDDIAGVNATFYYYLNSSNDPDDNSVHYTNSSCFQTGTNLIDEKYFKCGFSVAYYANNGTWQCNATAVDTQDATGSLNDSTYINEFYALNLTPLIDFGVIPTGNISGEVVSTVNNIGNIEIDIGLDAYGTVDGDGVAMNCTENSISLSDERFSLIIGQLFADMEPITDTLEIQSGFDLPKQTNSTASSKPVYWRARATPPSSLGGCQGIIVFTATAS